MPKRRVESDKKTGRPKLGASGAGTAVAVRLHKMQRQWLKKQSEDRDITPSEYIRVVLAEQGMPE